MSWSAIARTLEERADRGLLSAFRAEVTRRVETLDVLTLSGPAEAARRVSSGWRTRPLPGCPGAQIVESEWGWGCLPTLRSARLETAWDAEWDAISNADTLGGRLRLIATAALSRAVVFERLGTFAEAVLNQPFDDLHAGVWDLVESRLPVGEYRSLRTLHALCGQVDLPVVLFEDLGLFPVADDG